MPPTSVEKMLETMMMQMLRQDPQAANVVCCNCFKMKKRETCCKCHSENNASRKQKKRRRTLKKSCLKTIISISKTVKDGGKCQGFPDNTCCRNVAEDTDERFCSKCGQLLPDMVPEDQPSNHPDQCVQQLERCHQECQDMGVQVNDERKERLSVHIKVCPCPNINPGSQDEKPRHSVSVPELSSTTPRLADDANPDNLVSDRVPHAHFEDSTYDESRPSHRPLKELNETTHEWSVGIASLKKLVLNMAKARLAKEAACWEGEYYRRHQSRQQEMTGEPTDESSEVDPMEIAKAVGGPGFQHRLGLSFEDEQGETAPRPPVYKKPMVRTYPNTTNHDETQDADIRCSDYPGTTQFGASYTPGQEMSAGCCDSANVYCYSPENGPSPFGDHCEHACTCGDTGQFQPYFHEFPGPHSGYPYQTREHQHDCGEQDSFRPDPHALSSGSFAKRPRSPCR